MKWCLDSPRRAEHASLPLSAPETACGARQQLQQLQQLSAVPSMKLSRATRMHGTTAEQRSNYRQPCFLPVYSISTPISTTIRHISMASITRTRARRGNWLHRNSGLACWSSAETTIHTRIWIWHGIIRCSGASNNSPDAQSPVCHLQALANGGSIGSIGARPMQRVARPPNACQLIMPH